MIYKASSLTITLALVFSTNAIGHPARIELTTNDLRAELASHDTYQETTINIKFMSVSQINIIWKK